MMNESLRAAIVDLATRFADEVLDLISSAVVEEVIRANGGGAGRRSRLRRSDQELRAAEERILGALRKNPAGMRAEDLRGALGFSRPQIGRPLKALLGRGEVKKSGERRLTMYRAAEARRKPAGAKKAARSAAAKPAAEATT